MIDLQLIKNEIENLLKNEGYELAEFDFSKVGSDMILHIEIDKESSISMDDIVEVSGKISELLDVIDKSTDAYMLDVSSSGIEKKIKIEDLKNKISEYVSLELIEPVKGTNEIIGTIIDANEDEIIVSYFLKGAPKKSVINLKNISIARKAIKF
jgi:ribosome maturation factor RimP